MPDFQASIELPQKIQLVFDYIRRPVNLVKLLAGSKDEIEYRVPEKLEQGSQLEFSMSRFGVKIVIVLEVVELVEQKRIFLKQTKGPFRRWLHEYTLVEQDENKTQLTERVSFDPPSGFLGMFITNDGIMSQLKYRIPNGHNQLKDEVSKLST